MIEIGKYPILSELPSFQRAPGQFAPFPLYIRNWNLDLQYLNLLGTNRLEIEPTAGAQQDAICM